MKKIIIVFTGGTIAMKIDEKTNAAVPAINGEQILQMTPGIGRIAEIDFLNFSNIPGPHMTPEKMFELSKTIQHKLEVEGFDGAVVTHGTDSLEETAYLVDLTSKSNKPIVFVGAMKNI
jgi:L-asparaginase